MPARSPTPPIRWARVAPPGSSQDISGTARATQLCGTANQGACKDTVNIGKAVIDGFEAQVFLAHGEYAGITDAVMPARRRKATTL